MKKSDAAKTGPVFMQHPLSQIPRDIVLKGLVEIGKSHEEKFHILLNKVTDILRSKNPLHIMSTLSMYGLMGGMSSGGKMSPLHKDQQFNQSHVELAQASALQIPIGDLNFTPAVPQTIQELFDVLPDLGQAFALQRLVAIEREKTEEQKAILVLQEHLRLHTQSVRNWGFFKRVVTIARRLYEPINPLFQKQIGVSATNLIDIFENHINRIEKFATARLITLRDIFSEKNVEGIIRKYYSYNPQIQDSPETMIEYATQHSLTSDQIKSLLLSHSDLALTDELTFTSKAVAQELGLSSASLSAALDKLSLSFGALSHHKAEYFFLDNPVWTKPLIKLGNGRYFCSMPQVFFSFIFQIFDELAGEDVHAQVSLHERRAEFLESEIVRIFTEAFPGSEHLSKYKWSDNGTEYENDLLIRVDSHLILVEAKSGAISWPALRGAPNRAKRHVEELFFEPSIQSFRLANRIKEAISKQELRGALLPNFPLSLDHVKNVLRLSVTLEDFAVLQSNLHVAKDAGWIAEDHPLAACMLLADLEIVFDILESTAQKIHYIKRRSELEANMKYSGDELDLLGFYLLTGFNIGDAEFNGQHFQLVAMSDKIDEYYTALDNGIQRDKPRLKLTQWWKDICNRLEDRDFHQWSDVANILLSFSFAEQQDAGRYFHKIKKNVFKNWRKANHRCSVIIIPNMHRSDALGLYAFRDRDKELRQEHMQNIASQIFDENPHVQRCVILGVNIDKKHYPYSTLMVFLQVAPVG